MSNENYLLKLEQSVNELYEKYPKEVVNPFLERISEMTAEEFEALVFFCELIEKDEAEKKKESTNQ